MQSARFLLFFVLFAGSVLVKAEWYERKAAAMGTEISVELWAESYTTADKAIDKVIAEMERIDAAFSPYKETSELSRVNRDAANGPLTISAELHYLLSRAETIATMSDGAFDISYASVGHLYDYRNSTRPTEAQRQAKLPAINYQHIILAAEPATVRFAKPDVLIDLGGIAKGHAVDRAIDLLTAMGIEHALVSAGGDSRLLGDKRGRPWVSGIKDPRGEEPLLLLPLENVAISTSGDYERYFIDSEQGVRYHHIVSPSTGDSSRAVRSATIIAPDSTTADALSTSVFVLGPAKGLALINRLPEIDAVIIDEHGLLHYSSGLLQAQD